MLKVKFSVKQTSDLIGSNHYDIIVMIKEANIIENFSMHDINFSCKYGHLNILKYIYRCNPHLFRKNISAAIRKADLYGQYRILEWFKSKSKTSSKKRLLILINKIFPKCNFAYNDILSLADPGINLEIDVEYINLGIYNLVEDKMNLRKFLGD